MNSITPKNKANFLRLVEKTTQLDPVSPQTFVRPAWQTTFFANENPSLLLFLNFEQMAESDFDAALAGARPKYLFDLRRVPRFDLGNLNRKKAFQRFSNARIQYLDFSGLLKFEGAHGSDPKLVARLIADSSNQALVTGPLGFLVDAFQFEEAYITKLIEALPSRKEASWDILRLPISAEVATEKQGKRNLLFISHANPQDNAFATWLAGRLTLAGYSVWSDVTKLFGGETFWDDIESAVREQSAKVIVVLSKEAQKKPGVLDEIDLAVRVERSLGLQRFVLPIRIDDLPHSEVRANIARKTIIDFSDNWASGLHSLLSILERDRVPREVSGNAKILADWVTDRCAEQSHVVEKPEQLTTNWLPIVKLPDTLSFYSISASNTQIDSVIRSIKSPCFRYLRMIGSFSSLDDLQRDIRPDVILTSAYRINTTEFLGGKVKDLPGLTRGEARKATVNLLRQAWNAKMELKGLRAFETASGHLAWYMPNGLIDKNRMEFLDNSGKKRRKSLVGWSERRKVFWHFAVEARPVLGEFRHYVLKQHVIFTADGTKPVESKERMHLLRRRFCKSWWNDRWRDLLIAFVSWLQSGDESVLAVGADIVLAADLMSVISPFSITIDESAPASFDEDEEGDELDSGDEVDQFDDEFGSDPPDELPETQKI